VHVGIAELEGAVAKVRSQQIARLHPPAIAGPSTAAMTGSRDEKIASR